MTIEQMFMMQTQAVQAIGQTLAAIQQQQPPPPQPQMPRDKRAEFMRGHPPTFAHSSDPIDAEDWLRTVERELYTAQCDDREKVLYGPRLLRGAAQFWWESYLATHANPDTITWEEFRGSFHQYHCWGEGIAATLRSKSSPVPPVRRRQNGQGHPSLGTTPDEGLRRGPPTVRPRPVRRPTYDPAHCNGPCAVAVCYRPHL
jgi:hypothetical protein